MENYYLDYSNSNFNSTLNKYEFQNTDEKSHIYQHPRQLLVRNLISKNTIYDSILLYHQLGTGKCHALNTPIIMFDGSIKMVQDIKKGELLMGDDSTPRTVLSLARGQDTMYSVTPVKGDTYTVNKEHILVLKYSRKPHISDKKYNTIRWFDINNKKDCHKNFKIKQESEDFLQIKLSEYKKHENIIEITINDYIQLSKSIKSRLKGYRVPVSFPEKELPIDPYMIGFWLGPKSLSAPSLCSHLDKYVKVNEANLMFTRKIPTIYKCNSRKNQLALLAGLLDSDGSLSKNKDHFEFSQSLEHKQIIDDVIFLCRSLGFACYKNKKKTTWTYQGIKKSGEAWRIFISGNGIEEIPTLILKVNPRKQVKDVLVTGITVKEIGQGDYYGFTLNENNRYLLGDFTVTHNTCAAISIAEGFKEYINNMGNRIVILVKNGNIEENFRQELRGECINNPSLYNIEPEIGETLDDLQNKINRKINKIYSFVTYGTFVNQVIGAKIFTKDKYGFNTNEQVKDSAGKPLRKKTGSISFNNTVIIIDEAHNVTNNDVYLALEKALKNSYNYRLVLLTATPMYDNVKEIFEISNLLNMNHKENLLPIRNDLFKEFNGGVLLEKNNSGNLKGSINTITEYGKQVLEKSLLGKISYLASNTESFALKIDKGTPLTTSVGSINIIECVMTPNQYSIYNKAYLLDSHQTPTDISDEIATLDSDDAELENEVLPSSSSLYKNSSDASTFTFPGKKYGKDGYNECFSNGKLNSEYDYIFGKHLQRYSCKFFSLLENINNSPGNIFIYSNYVNFGGIALIKQLLLSNGFKKYDGSSDGKRFVMYDDTLSVRQRENYRKIFNSTENRYGDIIKIIVGSPIISEGISLYNVRQVHILEPSWNMSRINQIIGRAIRYQSHNALPKEERTLEIYKYVSIGENGDSIDKQKYLLSEFKDRANKIVERLLKRVAFDCNINVKNGIGGIGGSPQCDYQDCDYQCNLLPPNNNFDKFTYNMFIDFFEKYDIEYIIELIKDLYKKYFIWSIDDIISKITQVTPVSSESIFTALYTLVNNKVIITDKYNREGYLIQKDTLFIFNPIDHNINTSIFAKILDFNEDKNMYNLQEYLKKYNKIPEKEIVVKHKKQNVNVTISELDLAYNQNIMNSNKLYRNKGVKSKDEWGNNKDNWGPIDNNLRIVDLIDIDADQQDFRKIPTGMVITSKNIKDLLGYIDYLNIPIDKFIGYHTRDKNTLLKILQEHTGEENAYSNLNNEQLIQEIINKDISPSQIKKYLTLNKTQLINILEKYLKEKKLILK